VGLIDGNTAQVVNQLIAIGITIALSVVATFAILKFVDLVVGVRVSGEDELRGLDLSQHSEEAYCMEIDLHPVVHPAHEPTHIHTVHETTHAVIASAATAVAK
jgi:Ammonium Transporter Family